MVVLGGLPYSIPLSGMVKSRNGRPKMSRKDSDGSGGIGGSWCSRKAALRVASPLNLERELGVLR